MEWPNYRQSDSGWPVRRRLRRVTVIVEDDEGLVTSQELDGRALLLSVKWKHSLNESADVMSFGEGGPLRQPHLYDSVDVTIHGMLDRPEEAVNGWMTLKILPRHPELAPRTDL